MAIKRQIGLFGMLFGCMLIAACENNLSEVQNLSSKTPVIVDKTYGLEMLYSDSGIVKSKIITPEAYHFKTITPYYEMKKGVTIIFYDPNLRQKMKVTSDYAIWRENQGIADLQKNVVATTTDGKVLRSEQVIWDKGKQQLSSDKLVTITLPNANGVPSILYGDGFISDEDLKYPNLIRGRGNLSVTDKGEF